MDWIEIVFNIFGYLLIWVAVDFKRPAKYRFTPSQKEWWFIMLLIVIGSILINPSRWA